ncbi:MAG: aminotransferase class III-fold pyridoxal phosphate-dependent enzyme [Clostridiales bacterium]|nr:aminotransferase class III-fold pyridoxal phosphate-dependent enzyme [Clostridiales bacterium]
MIYDIPGEKSKKEFLKIQEYIHGLGDYEREAAAAKALGHKPPAQMLVGKTKGDFIYDLDGNEYIDFHAGWASNPVGNANEEVIEVVTEAFKKYGFSYHHPLQEALAEKVAEITPNKALTRSSFEISGTEAAEAAVSYALRYKNRPLIISFSHSFHGDSLGAKTLSAITIDRKINLEAWRGGVIHVPYPITFELPLDITAEQYVDYIIWYIEEFICGLVAPAESIAGILLEPMLAEGGSWTPPNCFAQKLRKLCDKNDWMLISDEVLVGLGRTGKTWGIDHSGVQPDIMVIGKNITGGIMPNAMVVGTEKAMGNNSARSGSTFAGSPAGCAAGIKTLEIYERDNVIENAAKLGEIALNRMKKWEKEFPLLVTNARGTGLLLGATITDKEGNPSNEFGAAVQNEALKRGAYIINDTEPSIRLYPALNMDEKIMDKGLSIIEEALKEVSKEDYVPSTWPRYFTTQ